MSKTTITFSDEHLTVIQKALEAYSRAKMGQFKHWFEETFGWQYDWDTGADIEKFIRLRALERHLEKKYGQVEMRNKRADFFNKLEEKLNSVNFLDYYYSFVNSFPASDDEPFPRHQNASWGILQSEKVEDGQLAYEIYQTIRQFNAVKQNGGYFNHLRSTDDPMSYSGVELPKIDGFVKYKDFKFEIKDALEIEKLYIKEKWKEMWEFINKILPKYDFPSGEKYEIFLGPGDAPPVYRVHKPRKEEKPLDAAPKTT